MEIFKKKEWDLEFKGVYYMEWECEFEVQKECEVEYTTPKNNENGNISLKNIGKEFCTFRLS